MPTKKTPLRIFLEKVEGASFKNHTNILVVCIVSAESEAKFNKEVEAYYQEIKDDYFDTDEFEPPFIKIQKVLYVNAYL